MSFKGYSIFISGSHFIQRSGTIFSNFGKESHKEHFFEIILKSVHWSRRRCHLKVFLFFFLSLAAPLFSGAERF